MNKYNGLNKIEVENNKRLYGNNELEKNKKPNFLWVFINEFKDLLVIILIIAAILSIVIDPNSLIESMIIFLILIINATIGAIQEVKAYKTLDSLKRLSEHKVLVVRDGINVFIDAHELVVGDLVILNKGDSIDADMKLILSNDLKVDESSLTGESIPIEKKNNDLIYSLTYVIGGSGRAIVKSVGMNTKIGEIAKNLMDNKNIKTPLEIKLEQIGKVVGLIAICICIGVFFIELALNINVLDAFKSSISLAVAAIPEGLTTVVTVCLAIGVNKMAKQNVIIKRLEAVETLGCSSIICTDKTGTLTDNKEKIIEIYEDKLWNKEELHQVSSKLLDYMYMTSNPYNEDKLIDPIDNAIVSLFKDLNKSKSNFELKKYNTFNSTTKYMSVEVLYKNHELTLYKGAYDILVDIVKIKPKNEFETVLNTMMMKGYRVIAIATELKIIALIAMQDLPKENVEVTIEMAKRAGVKTIMITGDHVKTAFAIANRLNITNDINETITKKELDKLTDKELFENIEKYKVYSRVNPLDKVRIVNAWKEKGHIVAMTGDGVNDAPALNSADIGCAMGSGTEIAKDASDIIIVDSNYNTIVKAISNGRNIYNNIKNCCKYLLASNIGEVLTIVLITLLSLISGFNFGIPLASIQLLWINVITDSLPAFGLGLVEDSRDVMKIAPRKNNEGFFSNGVAQEILFIGISIGLITIISYLIGFRFNSLYATTMAFVTISTSQLLHSYNCISSRSIFNKNIINNKFLNYSFVIGILLEALVIYISPINSIFKLEKLPPFYLIISLILSSFIILISEIRKKIINYKK